VSAVSETTNTPTNMKSYDIAARLPLTIEARNAGATGRKFWWAHVGTVNATSKRAACAKARKNMNVFNADKLRAFAR
jgi:hypothetical protein